MTPSELKYNVENAGFDSHFFTRSSMKFFGDTMRNYGCCSAVINTAYDADGNYVGKNGVEIEVWELYRKQPVKHRMQDSAYFDKASFKRRYPVK